MTVAPTSPPQPSRTAGSPISCTDLTKSYAAGSRTIEILHGITLSVAEGEMCAVMGPSGSGKSTLLYCLAGLELPTRGTVTMLGRDTASLSRADLARLRRADVGFVFQSYNLIPSLSAYENVALPTRLDRRTPSHDLIIETLTELGIGEQANSRPPQLSGGEQQRVALARVLVQQPRLVFADEPTGALDTATGQFVLGELVAIAHEAGRCVLTVTHDPHVAAFCDRVVVLRDGLLVDELRAPKADQVTAVLAGLSRDAER